MYKLSTIFILFFFFTYCSTSAVKHHTQSKANWALMVMVYLLRLQNECVQSDVNSRNVPSIPIEKKYRQLHFDQIKSEQINRSSASMARVQCSWPDRNISGEKLTLNLIRTLKNCFSWKMTINLWYFTGFHMTRLPWYPSTAKQCGQLIWFALDWNQILDVHRKICRSHWIQHFHLI